MKHKILAKERKFETVKIEISLESQGELNDFYKVIGETSPESIWGDLYDELKSAGAQD